MTILAPWVVTTCISLLITVETSSWSGVAYNSDNEFNAWSNYVVYQLLDEQIICVKLQGLPMALFSSLSPGRSLLSSRRSCARDCTACWLCPRLPFGASCCCLSGAAPTPCWSGPSAAVSSGLSSFDCSLVSGCCTCTQYSYSCYHNWICERSEQYPLNRDHKKVFRLYVTEIATKR